MIVIVKPGDTVTPYLYIICLDDVLCMSIDQIKENSFILKKARNGSYPAETMTNTECTFLLHRLDPVVGSTDLNVNKKKKEEKTE